MENFSIRDLRTHTGKLIDDAEHGKLSIISKHGRPVIIAVPFTERLIELGIEVDLAIYLFQTSALTLEKAAKLSGVSLEAFIEKIGKLEIPAVKYSQQALEQELKDFE